MPKAKKIVPVTVTTGITIIINKEVLKKKTLHLINKQKHSLPAEIDADLPYKPVGNIYKDGPKSKFRAQWYQCGATGCYHHAQGVAKIRMHLQRHHQELLTAAEFEAWRDKGLDRVECEKCGDPVPKRFMKLHKCKPRATKQRKTMLYA